MPLGAISLRNNAQCCKPQANKAQSFGKKEHDNEHKNHKAAYIAGSVGLVAALAVAAYLFRGKIAEMPFFKKAMTMGENALNKTKEMSETVLNKTKEFGEDALKKTKEFGDDALKKTKEVKDNVVDATKEFGQKIKEKSEDIAGKGRKVFKRVRTRVFNNPVAKPTFTADEQTLLTRFKRTGANQQGVFDILKAHGLKESEEKYIKETLPLLKAEMAKRGGKTKPVSMRTLINEALKKETTEEIITDLLETSKNLRKKWNV